VIAHDCATVPVLGIVVQSCGASFCPPMMRLPINNEGDWPHGVGRLP
jgi:hypothetical protein